MAIEHIQHIEFDAQNGRIGIISPNNTLRGGDQPEQWFGQFGVLSLNALPEGRTYVFPRTGKFSTPNSESFMTQVVDNELTAQASPESTPMALAISTASENKNDVSILIRPDPANVRLVTFHKNGAGWEVTSSESYGMDIVRQVLSADDMTAVGSLRLLAPVYSPAG